MTSVELLQASLACFLVLVESATWRLASRRYRGVPCNLLSSIEPAIIKDNMLT